MLCRLESQVLTYKPVHSILFATTTPLSCTRARDKIYLQYNIVTLRPSDASEDSVTRSGCACEGFC